MARKGERDREARSGVQGVSSSAWLEIIKVWVGKMPLCQAGEKVSGVVRGLERIPPLAWIRRSEDCCNSNNGWGIRINSFRCCWMSAENVDHVFL